MYYLVKNSGELVLLEKDRNYANSFTEEELSEDWLKIITADDHGLLYWEGDEIIFQVSNPDYIGRNLLSLHQGELTSGTSWDTTFTILELFSYLERLSCTSP